MSMINEFKDFIARGNVIDMAVGIIVGAAFTGIVNSLVADVFMPILGLVTSGLDFSNLFVALNGEHYDTLKAARDAGAPVLAFGLLINAIVNFLIVAFVIFQLVRQINRLRRTAETPAAPPAPPEDVVLLREIRDSLKKAA
ncbi:MAG TPA: large conductance mechanosensitive channel protein MscL [Alphaproteobacteria bacterium]|nr:large conductance mechanosensitive channel protein MscL [Alphaproteobacteria bacterium]